MKRLPLCVILAALVGPASADEIQTKDGKKVEFKALTDEGDYWELTTPQGTKVTVKKADFDRLIPGGVKEAPLTGATFAFDKKRKLTAVDLLAKIDIKKDELVPSWKQSGATLTGAGVTNRIAKLQISHTPPEEYDLTMVAECKESNGDNMLLGLIGGGKQFGFVLGPTAMGIPGVDTAFIPGKHLPIKAPPKTFTFMVRREAFIVQADGKDLYTWKADWSKPVIPPLWLAANKNTFFLTVEAATVVIHRMTLTAPKE